MTPIARTDGRYEVRIPRKLTRSGKQESRYFPSKTQASKFIAEFRVELREHGKSAVTGEDREWITYVKRELCDLSLLSTVIQYWKSTGQHLKPCSAQDAVKAFLIAKESDYPNKLTWNDISERLAKFSEHFGDRPLHQISIADIEEFLGTCNAGWNRWAFHKRIRPLFKFAKSRQWITTNPMEDVTKPKTPTPERLIYTPDQFQQMLWMCQNQYPDLLPYVVLCGFCFMRTSELVRKYAYEKVVQWSDVLWDDGLIHVRPGVAKGTKRETDERYAPLNETARAWLEPYRQDRGDCVPVSASKLYELFGKMTDAVDVPRIDNGLRHSCITYSLAANPQTGQQETARWAGNSEATIKQHYLRLIKPAQGKAWFAVKSITKATLAELGLTKADLPEYEPSQPSTDAFLAGLATG
jgi:integrase